MVERHVEDDLDPGAMQRLHHVAELVERAEGSRARAVGRVGREKGERRVAPVVREPRRRILRVELEHGQELHRGDAQVLKIGDLVDQPPVSPARLRGQPGARVAREAAHVQLVDDGVKNGRCSGTSPSQSYACGSATTLLIAMAQSSPGPEAARRL